MVVDQLGQYESDVMSQWKWHPRLWSQRAILGGIALGGGLVCIGLYYALLRWEQGQREADFHIQVQHQFYALEEHLRNTLEAVETVGAFFRSSQYVSPEEFRTFVRPLLRKHPCLHEVGWAGPEGLLVGHSVPEVLPKTKLPSGVDEPERASPGLKKEPEFLPHADLKEASSSTKASSGAKDSPRPQPGLPPKPPASSSGGWPTLKIYYLEVWPPEETRPPFLPLDRDLRGVPGGDLVLEQLRSGKELAIGRIALRGEAGERQWAFLIGVAVSRSGLGSASEGSLSAQENAAGTKKPIGPQQAGLGGSATSEGVVFGIAVPGVLIEHALKERPNQEIDIYWYEGQAEQDGQLICYWPASEKRAEFSVADEKWLGGMYECRPVFLGGQAWRFYGVPGEGFWTRRANWIPELVFGGALMAVCILVSYVHILFTRHQQAAALAAERTGQLQKAQEDFQRREQWLRDSQGVYWSLVDELPGGILCKNREGRYIFANRAFCQQLKRPLEEVLGKSDFDFYPAELAEKSQADDRWVMETGQCVDTVEQIVEEGEKKYIRVIKFPLRAPTGEIMGVLVILGDITARRRAQLAVEKERSLLQALMDWLPDGIFFKDQQSRYIRINRAMATSLGLRHPSEAEGKTDFDFFSQEYAQQSLADEQYILATGRPILNKEEKLTWPDGHVSWLLTIRLPWQDPDGEVIGIYGICRDITQQKMETEALKAAKEAAETAREAKTQFLANISHELRNPLHGLLGLTELVLEGPLEATQRAYVEMIRDAGENLLLVLNDLLDFSKIEAGRLQLERIAFRLRQVVAETLKSLAFLAHGKGLSLVWYIRPEVSEWLVGDPLRLRQILVNLVANAIKFTDEGEIQVEVACLDRQPDRIELHFQVRDTGIGIPPEKLESIFEMFEQSESSTARRYGGSGLGLAICSRLVHLMQGRIWAESQPGQGSCFHFTGWFELPKQPEPWPPTEQRALLENRPIVLIESHPVEQQNLQGLLSAWGMEPILLASLAEAKTYWELSSPADRRVDIVVCGILGSEQERGEMVERLGPWLAGGGRIIWLLPAGCPPPGPWPPQPSHQTILIKPYTPSELLQGLLWALGEAPAPWSVSGAAAMPALESLRILVAEDSPVGQQLAVGVLERHGHKVTLVRTGREALAAVQAGAFDLVLMDLEMPEMDGWEAAKAIREWEKEKGGHLPIIAVTAHELPEQLAKIRAYGMDHYIVKPLRARPLFQTIRQVLPQARRPLETEESSGTESASPAPSPAVDWQAVANSLQGDEHLLREVAAALWEEAPKCFQQLQAAVAQQHSEEVRLAAHRLKGSVRLLGPTTVYEQAWAIEQLARQGSFPSAETMQQLQEALEQLLQEVRNRVGIR